MKIKYGKVIFVDKELIKIDCDKELYIAFPKHNVELNEGDEITFISRKMSLGEKPLLIAEDIRIEKHNILKKQ